MRNDALGYVTHSPDKWLTREGGRGRDRGRTSTPNDLFVQKRLPTNPSKPIKVPGFNKYKIINKSADEPLPKRPPAARTAVSAHTSGRRGRLLAGRREQGGAGYFMARRTPSASGVGVGPAAVVIAPFNFRGSLIDGEVNEDNRVLKL